MHATISPGKYHWAGARRDGMWWNYWVTQYETRATLYIDEPDGLANKRLFDDLAARRPEIERAFGGHLEWARNDDRRASWIGVRVPGGWVDETTWQPAIVQAVDAMGRIYQALAPRIRALRQTS